MNNILNLYEGIARNLNGITFFKILIPVLSLAGPAAFLFYGYKGITHKETIMLFRQKSFNNSRTITGKMAVFYGFLYLIFGTLLGLILIPTSYYMLIEMMH